MLCYTQSRTMTRTLPTPPPTHPSHCIHYVFMTLALRSPPFHAAPSPVRKSFAGSGIPFDHSPGRVPSWSVAVPARSLPLPSWRWMRLWVTRNTPGRECGGGGHIADDDDPPGFEVDDEDEFPTITAQDRSLERDWRLSSHHAFQASCRRVLLSPLIQAAVVLALETR